MQVIPCAEQVLIAARVDHAHRQPLATVELQHLAFSSPLRHAATGLK